MSGFEKCPDFSSKPRKCLPVQASSAAYPSFQSISMLAPLSEAHEFPRKYTARAPLTLKFTLSLPQGDILALSRFVRVQVTSARDSA
jgi:hypothetical protein